ncbi:MAG TPA: metallophosphoesterase family protein [Aliidongia sp.]|nr:metallophosphoesterase family protein [Aliidongia sp.]
MPTDKEQSLELSRRKLLAAAGLYGGAATLASVLPAGSAEAASAPRTSSDPVATSPVAGLHLQYGADASAEIVVSWHTLEIVHHPRVLVGRLDGKLEHTVAADQASYVDGKSKQTVYAYHAKVRGLKPNTEFLYCALHDGAQAEFGTFRTAPRGRAAFTFTSFGDQGTPTMGRKFALPPGVTLPNPPAFVNDNLGSPAAGDTTLGVERLQPLFHLFNGDLCYANLAQDRVRTWWDFWENNSRSARNRPWMPSPGNHENELGNGPIGFQAYQTYFSVPEAAGQTEVTKGLWYAFTAGSVRVVSIANDDICYQDGGNSYVRGYSSGAQKLWLERELAAARADRDIDWIVVCMHQVAISTADKFNGADLGIREEWVPLFDRYGVDLVVCGHEHHYERSHPIRGREANQTLTPVPAATATDIIDTTKGTVHMVIGGGGTSSPSNQLFFDPPQCRVITAVAASPDPATGKRAPVYVTEHAPWSAVRNAAQSYGFAAFTVDPGARPGDMTTIKVTYYDVVGLNGQIAPFESFTLRRPRRD